MKRISSAISKMLLALAVPALAAVRGPYAPDSATLHLYHFDGNVEDAVSSNPIHLTLAYGATVSESSYEGFGMALNTYEGSSNTSSNQPIAYADEKAVSNFVGSDGAFTFEAIVKPAGPIPNHMQIISGEDDSTSTRGWQFRINLSGQLEFIKLTGAQENFASPLPTVGEHGWAAGQWFHVAVTYNGQENTADNLKFYWTRLDSGAAEANLLASFQMSADLSSTPRIDFAVGNEGRDYTGENFEGLVDEVRISSIERQASDMLFLPGSPPPLIVIQPQGVQVRQPGGAVLETVFESQTEPAAVWYRSLQTGDVPVDTSSGRIASQIVYDDLTHQYTAQLIFTETQITDGGSYYCQLSNESNVWRSSQAVDLRVEGLLAYWTLDASAYADGVYADAVSGWAAVVSGLPVFVEGVDGTAGGAVRIGLDSGWAVSEPLDLTQGTGVLTASMWVRWLSNAVSRADVQMECWPEQTLISAEDELVSEGRWQHICVVYTGLWCRVYVDGVLRAEGEYVLPSDTTAQLVLGGGLGGLEVLEGDLDEVRVYNYAMDSEGVAQLYYEMTGQGVCLLEHRSVYDLTGPEGEADCRVDLYDLAVFASGWLAEYDLADLADLASQWKSTSFYPN